MSEDSAILVQALSEATGIDFELGDDDAVVFNYLERNVLLRFIPEGGVCLVCSEVGLLEQVAVPAGLSELLEANYLLYDTAGGALSWSQTSQMVSLNFLLPAAANRPDEFINHLNRALSAVDQWTQRVSDMNARAQSRISAELNGQVSGEAAVPELTTPAMDNLMSV